MKTIASALALIGLILCCAKAQEQSLLSNDEFAIATKASQWPDDWERDKASPVTWELEDGKHFLRFVAPPAEQVIQLSRTIALPADLKGVALLVRFRVANFKFGTSTNGGPAYVKDMHFKYQFLDAEDKSVRQWAGGFAFHSLAKNWTDIKKRFLVPDGAVKLKLTVLLNQIAAGTLDVATIRINPLAAEESDALLLAAARASQRAAEDAVELPKILALPPKTVPIKVAGNKLVANDGTNVWLQGVNVCSLEWSAEGENVLRSTRVAVDDWKANAIRLPVHDGFWFGRGKAPQTDSNDAEAYRRVVDDVVKLVAARGGYVILGLHRFQAPDNGTTEFWKDAATRYKDNPAILFDIFNEPHGISWEVWRNGMQGIVDTIRSAGAKNIIVASGIGYAYDLSGILDGFGLADTTGNGIMYSTHFYNWHKDWEKNFLRLADKYPLIVGEFGADVKKMSFVPAGDQEDPFTWSPDALGLVQKYHLNWTAFSFHPKATPVLLKNWDYEPTPFWGAFVKDALGGKQFELKRLR